MSRALGWDRDVSTGSVVELDSGELAAQIDPTKGCDILGVVDVPSRTELLFRTPWGGRADAAAFDSTSRWLADYRGGWQVLCPNAGPAREVDGAVRGFHGEAAIVPWNLGEVDGTSLSAHVELFTAPVRLDRSVRVDARTLTIEETLTNRSRRDREVVWMHHPAFAAPLISPEARIDLPPTRILADAAAPGTLLAADSLQSFSEVVDTTGRPVDLGAFPPSEQPREIFACLVEPSDGWAAITNPDVGLGVALRWDLDTFPYAWFWQELHATAGFPWFERAYVSAIEPSNALPGEGRAPTGDLRGVGATFGPGESVTTVLELTVFPAAGQVTDVGWGGRIVHEELG